jgi:hypothetical protein
MVHADAVNIMKARAAYNKFEMVETRKGRSRVPHPCRGLCDRVGFWIRAGIRESDPLLTSVKLQATL